MQSVDPACCAGFARRRTPRRPDRAARPARGAGPSDGRRRMRGDRNAVSAASTMQPRDPARSARKSSRGSGLVGSHCPARSGSRRAPPGAAHRDPSIRSASRRSPRSPTSVSILSASATATDTGSVGTRSFGPLRLVVVLAGVRRRLRPRPAPRRSSWPIRPCSSGNSPTTSVSRSALHSRAARFAILEIGADHRRELGRQSLDALNALVLRAELLVKHDAARTSAADLPAASSGRSRRRTSRPRAARGSRARCRRRSPCRRRCASMLETRMNLLTSLAVCGSRSTKHFWLLRMVARITSGGISRNASSNEPISTTGHSTRPATSSSSAVVLDQFEALREGEVLGVGEDDVARAARGRARPWPLELLHVVVEAAHRDRRRRHEAVAVGDVAGGDAVDRERHDLRLLGLRPEGRDDRMQRPHPGQRARLRDAAPAHRLRPREGAHRRRGRISRSTSSAGAAGLLDQRDVEVALLVRLDLRLVDRGESGALEKALRSRPPARRRAGPSSPRAGRAGARARPAR